MRLRLNLGTVPRRQQITIFIRRACGDVGNAKRCPRAVGRRFCLSVAHHLQQALTAVTSETRMRGRYSIPQSLLTALMSEVLGKLLPNSRCAIAFSSLDFRFEILLDMAELDLVLVASPRGAAWGFHIVAAHLISLVIQCTSRCERARGFRAYAAIGCSSKQCGSRLATPRETRAALLYVLQNWAKHGRGGDYDPRSSAMWFDGWSRPPPVSDEKPAIAQGQTWLVRV